MNPFALTRVAFNCSFSVQKNLIRFAFNGHRAIRSFEKRLEKGKPFFPAFMMLSITNSCNLKCEGCWVEQTTPPQELSLKQIQGVIDTAARYDSKFFGILGGEPLLHEKMMTLFDQNPKAYFQLFTNGFFLNDDVCSNLARLGNVTPLISIEGLETESDLRRGGNDVFARSLDGLDASVRAGLFTGVSASINKRNFHELVSTKYLELLIERGVHYIWYYIYRPCGGEPNIEIALDEDQIYELRKFIVEQRQKAKIIILDAYWDGLGQAVCPGAMGISHHIAPNGAVEFCPVIQLADDYLDDNGGNLESIFQKKDFLKDLRRFTADSGRSCILMESPGNLVEFMDKHEACDSSNRNLRNELINRAPLKGHDLKNREIPEKSWAYRLGKKYYFFGFGAYG